MQTQTPPGKQTAGVVIAVDEECDVMVRVRGEEITPGLRAKMDRVAAQVKRTLREGS